MLEEQIRESPVITRRYVCDQLKRHHSGPIRDRESSYLDGFTASIIRFALIVDELGMYPKKVGAELTKVLDLRGTDNQADDPLVGDLKRSIVENAILNRICANRDQKGKVIDILERSDALKAVIELIGSEVVLRAFKNGQDIAATTALDGAEEQCKLKLPKGFPEVQEIEQFVRGLFKDQPVFCVSKILECSVNKPSAQQNASRRAIGQIFDCLRAAQVAPDGDLTKLVVARFILCDVDHHLGARFRKSADELYEYRKSLSESALFGQPSKPLAEYVQEQVSLQEEVYLVGLRGKLHEEIQNFSHSVF